MKTQSDWNETFCFDENDLSLVTQPTTIAGSNSDMINGGSIESLSGKSETNTQNLMKFFSVSRLLSVIRFT